MVMNRHALRHQIGRLALGSALLALPAASWAANAGHANGGKPLSKATLSAMQPVDQAQLLPTPDADNAATQNAAARPAVVMNAAPVASLQSVAPSEAPSALASSLSRGLSDQTNLEDDEGEPLVTEPASLETPREEAAQLANAESLGEQQVSVIDRIADKPKATPIAKGPLRLKVHDKALRATVKIPLTGPNP